MGRGRFDGTARWRWLAAGLAIAFGVATVLEGGHVLFGGAEARAAAGDFVPFVLWFNFAAGFAYVAAGVGALLGRRWAVCSRGRSPPRRRSCSWPSACTSPWEAPSRRGPSRR